MSISNNLLWASTGGGWRAMFADVGYANLFQQAGVFDAEQSYFKSISTVSGGSWFSTQLFYSAEFYNRTVMAPSPDAVHDFVVEWMGSYYDISTDISEETIQKCNFTDLDSDDNEQMVETMTEFCQLLETFDYDWAKFVQAMLVSASEDYGSTSFTEIAASMENIISPLENTDLQVLAAFAPASRVRGDDASIASYLGGTLGMLDSDDAKLWSLALPAAWIVDTAVSTEKFFAGVSEVVGDNLDPSPEKINIYRIYTQRPFVGRLDFFLYILVMAQPPEIIGTLRPLFGGRIPTTLQVAAISSAAAASASPLAPVSYTQNLSIGSYVVYVNTVKTVWRVLAGIAAGIGVGMLLGIVVAQLRHRYDVCKYCSTKRLDGNASSSISEKDHIGCKDEDVRCDGDNDFAEPVRDTNENYDVHNNCCCCSCEHPARNWGIGCGIVFGILAGVITATLYGLGSIIVPNVYDESVDKVYQDSSFDNFAVCSQWPNLPCQEDDAYMMDGWFVDNPALPINIGHIQKKIGRNGTIKVILTNCNDVWDNEWNRAQYLAYFSTYFNKDIAPGNYSWGPGWFVPSRSQQIFSDYLDPAGLDALLEPIAESNMTTALLQGTTIDNPAYNVRRGQRVEMLLLNTNADITTYVIGKTAIETYTQPLANMARHIAGNEELLARVKNFVAE